MKTTCPECGARFRVLRPGSVVPCPACGNPVATSETAAAEPRPSRPAVEAPQPAQEQPQMPWLLAGAVVVVLVLAHYALYLLITGDARTGIEELESRHGLAVREKHESPGSTPPAANSPRYKAWHQEHAMYAASKAYADHEAHRSLVSTGLAISVLVQLGITGFALLRMNARIQRQMGGRRVRSD
ncbi:MAG: hypothetical protein QNJ98_15715 [Planctomycetota bacterium]|nr:hypothetical protein [Planctomycetota bacterium]